MLEDLFQVQDGAISDGMRIGLLAMSGCAPTAPLDAYPRGGSGDCRPNAGTLWRIGPKDAPDNTAGGRICGLLQKIRPELPAYTAA